MARLKVFAVLSAEFEPVTRRKRFLDIGDGALAVVHRALKVAAFDAELHADVAGVVLAINKRSTAGFADVGQFAKGNLLPSRCADEQIANFGGALAEFRLHADDEIE